MAEDFHPAGHLTESGARKPGARPAFGDPDHDPALVDGAPRDSLYLVEVPPARIRQVFRIHPQLFIKLAFDLELPLSGRRGDDMVLCFENGGEVVFEGFVGVAETEPTLHLLPPDGSLLPGDYVAEALDELGEAPPMTTEDALAFRAAQIESSAAAAPETAFPVQEILEDLEEQGIAPPALAAGPEADPRVNGEERVASAADLVSQVASALSDFDEGSESQAGAPQTEVEPTFWPLPEVAPETAMPEDEEGQASLPEEPPALLNLMQEGAGDPFAQAPAEEPVVQDAEVPLDLVPGPQEAEAPADDQLGPPSATTEETDEALHTAEDEILESPAARQQGVVAAPEVGSAQDQALDWPEAPEDRMPQVEAPAPSAGWPQPAGPQDAGPQDAGPQDAGPQDAGSQNMQPAIEATPSAAPAAEEQEEQKVFEALADAFELAAEVPLPAQVEAAEGLGPAEAAAVHGEQAASAEAAWDAGQSASQVEEVPPLHAVATDPVVPGQMGPEPDWAPVAQASPDASAWLDDPPAGGEAFEEPQTEDPVQAVPPPAPSPQEETSALPHQPPVEPASEADALADEPGTAFADPGAGPHIDPGADPHADPGANADVVAPMEAPVAEPAAADAVEAPGLEVEALDQAGDDSELPTPSTPGAEAEMPPSAEHVAPVEESAGSETAPDEGLEPAAPGTTEPEAADRLGEQEAGPSAEAPAREAAEVPEPEVAPPATPSPSPAHNEPSRSPQADAARMRVSLLRQKTAAAEPARPADAPGTSRDQVLPSGSRSEDQPEPATEAPPAAAADMTPEAKPETGQGMAPGTEASEAAAEPAKPAKPDAPAPGPATGRFLRTAVASVFRAGTSILPSRGESAPPPPLASEAADAPAKPDATPDEVETQDTAATVPADEDVAAQPLPDAQISNPEAANGQPAEPQPQVLEPQPQELQPQEPQPQELQPQELQPQELQCQEPQSQESPSGALPEASAEAPLSQGPGDPGEDLNPMDLFADPLAGEIAEFDGVMPEATPPTNHAPAGRPAPAAAPTGVARPVEVREAVLAALHQMEDSELFDFGVPGSSRGSSGGSTGAPTESPAVAPEQAAVASAAGSERGAPPPEMVDLPIEGAPAPVGVIFAEAPEVQAAAGPSEGPVETPDSTGEGAASIAETAAESQDGGELLDGEERR